MKASSITSKLLRELPVTRLPTRPNTFAHAFFSQVYPTSPKRADEQEPSETSTGLNPGVSPHILPSRVNDCYSNCEPVLSSDALNPSYSGHGRESPASFVLYHADMAFLKRDCCKQIFIFQSRLKTFSHNLLTYCGIWIAGRVYVHNTQDLPSRSHSSTSSTGSAFFSVTNIQTHKPSQQPTAIISHFFMVFPLLLMHTFMHTLLTHPALATATNAPTCKDHPAYQRHWARASVVLHFPAPTNAKHAEHLPDNPTKHSLPPHTNGMDLIHVPDILRHRDMVQIKVQCRA